MRIDTARNQLAATRALLDRALDQMEDLHVLAYDRQVAVDEAKVSGGWRDYALDTHGDIRAREAYWRFSDALSDTCGTLAGAAHDVLRILSVAAPATRGPRTTSALEHAFLLEAKARRVQRGEYQPAPMYPQSGIDEAIAASTQDVKRLERMNNRLLKALAQSTGVPSKTLRERYSSEPRSEQCAPTVTGVYLCPATLTHKMVDHRCELEPEHKGDHQGDSYQWNASGMVRKLAG